MPDLQRENPFSLFAVALDAHREAETASPHGVPVPRYTPPHNGTATSHAAAMDLMTSSKADRDRHAITMYLFHKPEGATRAEIEDATGIPGNSVRPRLLDLMGDNASYIGEAVVCRLLDAEGKPVTRIYGTHKAAEVLVHKNARRA